MCVRRGNFLSFISRLAFVMTFLSVSGMNVGVIICILPAVLDEGFPLVISLEGSGDY